MTKAIHWVSGRRFIAQAAIIAITAIFSGILIKEICAACSTLIASDSAGISLFGTLLLPAAAFIMRTRSSICHIHGKEMKCSSLRWDMTKKVLVKFSKKKLASQLLIAGLISTAGTYCMGTVMQKISQVINDNLEIFALCIAAAIWIVLRIHQIKQPAASEAVVLVHQKTIEEKLAA